MEVHVIDDETHIVERDLVIDAFHGQYRFGSFGSSVVLTRAMLIPNKVRTTSGKDFTLRDVSRLGTTVMIEFIKRKQCEAFYPFYVRRLYHFFPGAYKGDTKSNASIFVHYDNAQSQSPHATCYQM